MFVFTAKLSKTKLLAACVILVAAILLIVLLATSGGTEVPENTAPIGNTNDDRVAYLATFGWSVNAEPTETQKVRIPDSADNKVFARYNDLQRSQGFDLTDYAGKEVMRYVYEILNYPDATQPVYASILVYDGRIIGGDITDTAPDGLIHSFARPSGTSNPTPTQPSTETPFTSTEPTESSNATESTESTAASESYAESGH